MKTVLHNVKLVQDGRVESGSLLLEADRILEWFPSQRGGLPWELESYACLEGRGLYLSHGFIDIHVHGGGGHDFMDGTKEAWDGAGRFHLIHGTTGIVATTMASTTEEMEQAARLWEGCRGRAGGARLLGLHMEGLRIELISEIPFRRNTRDWRGYVPALCGGPLRRNCRELLPWGIIWHPGGFCRP